MFPPRGAPSDGSGDENNQSDPLLQQDEQQSSVLLLRDDDFQNSNAMPNLFDDSGDGMGHQSTEARFWFLKGIMSRTRKVTVKDASWEYIPANAQKRQQEKQNQQQEKQRANDSDIAVPAPRSSSDRW